MLLYVWLSIGDIMKKVRNIVRLMSIWFGGVVVVLSVWCSSDSMMMMCVKFVIISSIVGRNDSIVSSSIVCMFSE